MFFYYIVYRWVLVENLHSLMPSCNVIYIEIDSVPCLDTGCSVFAMTYNVSDIKPRQILEMYSCVQCNEIFFFDLVCNRLYTNVFCKRVHGTHYILMISCTFHTVCNPYFNIFDTIYIIFIITYVSRPV